MYLFEIIDVIFLKLIPIFEVKYLLKLLVGQYYQAFLIVKFELKYRPIISYCKV